MKHLLRIVILISAFAACRKSGNNDPLNNTKWVSIKDNCKKLSFTNTHMNVMTCQFSMSNQYNRLTNDTLDITDSGGNKFKAVLSVKSDTLHYFVNNTDSMYIKY